MPSIDQQLEKIMRGVVEVFTPEELKVKLKAAEKAGRPLRVKLGVDPTSPDIHLGHTVVLRKLRAFQDLGHTAVLIIGDYTARVGDPSGRDKTRPQLTGDVIEANAATYLDQVRKILDPDRLEIVRNGDWFAGLTFDQVLALASQMTVARLLERDDFKTRYTGGSPISLHEFMYPLMQGYDSVVVRSDVELGGTDQTFNLCVGRNFQRAAGQEPQVAITMPILVGTDGKDKMSKSYGNYIGVDEPAKDMYGKVMSIPDALMENYWMLLTAHPLDEVRAMLAADHPMEAKHTLAREITRDFHGDQAAQEAAAEFARVVQKQELPEDMPTVTTTTTEPTTTTTTLEPEDDEKVWLVGFIADQGMAASRSEARRLIQQGAVTIDGEKVTDPEHEFVPRDGMVLKVGKRRYRKFVKD